MLRRCSTPANASRLIGQGARRAAAEVTELAELTGGGIAKALLGRLLYEMLQPDSELDGWKDGSRP